MKAFTRVQKVSDAVVLERLQKAAALLGFGNVNIRTDSNGETYDPNEEQRTLGSAKCIFLDTNSLFNKIWFTQSHYDVRYERKPEYPYDELHLINNQNPEGFFNSNKAIADLFERIPPNVNFSHQAGVPFQEVLNAQILQLGKLGELTAKAKTDVEEERLLLRKAAAARLEEIEKERTDKLAKDDAAVAKRSSDLDVREKALDEREKGLDLKSNTAARRDLHKNQQKSVDELVKNVKDAAGLSVQWWFVFFGFVAILLAAGSVAYLSTAALADVILAISELSKAPDKIDSASSQKILTFIDLSAYYFMAKSVLASITFVVVGYAWVSWLQRSFRDKAKREQYLERVAVDTSRSNWLVETAFEWQQEKQGALPDLLVETLGQNLFSGEEQAKAAIGQKAASAMGGMKLKTPTFELSFNDAEKPKKDG